MDIYKRIDKTLDTEDIQQLNREELVKYYSRILKDNPYQYYELFYLILTNEYFKINVDLDRLLKLLKPLIKDKSTEIELLEYEILGLEERAFVDELNKSKKKLSKYAQTGELYIKTYFTKQHKEETLNNIITLSTNFFKVKLNPENEKHITFMKKMIDMRSSPILKKTEGNNETQIKTAIELLKLTFNMKSLLTIDGLANEASIYDFSKLIEEEFGSLSRQVSGASVASMASSVGGEKGEYYFNVEKLVDPNYFDLHTELIEYFTEILLRDDAKGLAIYENFYNDFISQSSLFKIVYFSAIHLDELLDKYIFDSALEDLQEDNLIEDPEEEVPDMYALRIQSFIPKEQKEDIRNGNLVFLTQELCLRLTLDKDKDFFEKLPLIYAQDVYEDELDIEEFQFYLKQIYKLGLKDFDPERYRYAVNDKEYDKKKEVKKTQKEVKKNIEREKREKQEEDLKKILTKFATFVITNYQVVLEENPHLNVKDDDEDLIEFTRDLMRIYFVASKYKDTEKYYNRDLELFVYIVHKIIKKPLIFPEDIIDDIFEINIAPFKRRINKILKK